MGSASNAWEERAREDRAGRRDSDGSQTRTGRSHALAPETRRHFQFISAAELAASCAPPVWQVPGILEPDSLAVVYGAPETGKSFLTIDWGCCTAAGLAWRGHHVRQGPVLMIVGEGRNGYVRRLKAWSLHHRIALSELPLHVSNMPTALTEPMVQAELEATVAQFSHEYGTPVLIVIDTLARNFGPGDENSTRDMSAAVAACDSLRLMTGAAVVVVHHSGKDAARGARGSMVLRGAIDAEYQLVRGTAGLVRFEAMKMKEAERPQAKFFQIQAVDLGFSDDQGEPVTSAVLVDVECHARMSVEMAATGKHQRRALEILRERSIENRENVRRSGRDESDARITAEVWRARCIEDGMPANRFNDAKKRLLKMGKVRAERGFVYLEGDEA